MNSDFPVSQLTERFNVAKAVIQSAGALAYKYYQSREQLQVESKAEPQDVVSIADREVETVIDSGLKAHFADDGFLGEEHGLSEGSNDWLWIVDPIDGTACFLNGLHTWCVSIALLHQGKPMAGLIYDPNANELFSAMKGQGAFVNGKPMSCHAADGLKQGLMGVGISHRMPPEACSQFIQSLLEEGGMFVRNGSGALMLAYVAAGRLVGYYEPHINSWDCMAAVVLITEAGGVVNDFLAGDGLLQGNPILASAGGVSSDLERLTKLHLNR
ncbi:inositol monophosphatase [Endozoicomonas sp. OPT23]|uniref:inositol monophosphatase family protein n=1 Tax=Endozoicomonas sp. OPT23 TaxID=2072845 RepID=UPI00129B3836|nr:inositol monophosphatase family protein [Endozoicomonas sp. OPT23]MRI33650.1 inositol monophosphatase [Endozoicomonas sp. OPT23]